MLICAPARVRPLSMLPNQLADRSATLPDIFFGFRFSKIAVPELVGSFGGMTVFECLACFIIEGEPAQEIAASYRSLSCIRALVSSPNAHRVLIDARVVSILSASRKRPKLSPPYTP